MQRMLTALKDVPDKRDRIIRPHVAPIPGHVVDLTEWAGPVKDQGGEGACTMFTGAGILEWHYRRFKGKDPVFSPQFGYRAERIIEGNVHMDCGAQSRTMMKVLATIGLCLESSDPYFDNGWRMPTTNGQLVEARKHRLGAYHRVIDLETLLSVLDSGFPAALAFTVYPTFMSSHTAKTGQVLLPGPEEKPEGGHETLCLGRDDFFRNHDGTEGALLVRNSWGLDWGVGGNFWLPYNYWPWVNDSWTGHFGHPW